MLNLTIVVVLLITVSFLCSILESVILSVTDQYAQVLIDREKKSGLFLKRLKNNIEQSLSAILILNTISNTAGATFAGALALEVYGSRWVGFFSAILTFLILLFAEILPKTMGAYYWRNLAPLSGYLIFGMTFLLKPIIIPVNYIICRLFKNKNTNLITKGEIINYIKLGYFQGAVESPEFEIANNLFKLRTIKVKDIMTPRSVVFYLNPDKTIRSSSKNSADILFSRIPLYDSSIKQVSGVVLRRDIMNNIAKSKLNITLRSLAHEPIFVMESLSVYDLMNILIPKKNHLAIVTNLQKDFTGIVSLEDAIETLLGREIVDEFDITENMRKLARKKIKRSE